MKAKYVEKCGSCIFWMPVERTAVELIGSPQRGDCYGAPPQVVPIINQGRLAGGMNIRPQTSETDNACSMYGTEEDLGIIEGKH